MTKGEFTWVHFSSENDCRSRQIYTRNLFYSFFSNSYFSIKIFSIRSGKIQLLLSVRLNHISRIVGKYILARTVASVDLPRPVQSYQNMMAPQLGC